MTDLAKIPSLWRLWLADTQVSDVTLDAFATASHLDMLDVRGTRVTPEGVARLAGKLPDLRIASDG